MNLKLNKALIHNLSLEGIELNWREMVFTFVLLLAVILLASYPDVFVAKSMYLDDYHRYMLGLENKLHASIVMRNIARAYANAPLYKLLSIDVNWARFALVALIYVPLSSAIYYLLRRFAKVPPIVAFFSSLLPCILPGQLQIPYFIDGSYTLQGLLVYVGSLCIGLKFIAKEQFSWMLFVFAVLVYVFSFEMMDHSVFLLPLSIAAFILVTDFKLKAKRILSLSAFLIAAALLKVMQIVNHPTSSMSVPIDPGLDLFIERTVIYIHTVLPYSYSYVSTQIEAVIIGLIFLAIMVGGLIWGSKKERTLIILGCLWAFCSMIVFLTVSRYYSPRYSHISGFGVNFILVLSLWVMFRRFKFIPERNTGLFVVLAFLSAYAVNKRVENQNKKVLPQNEVHTSIVADFKKYTFPQEAQLAIIGGFRIPTGGWWNYSTGYMKLATLRPDVTGIIGHEKEYYNPFGVERRAFQYQYIMSGLVLDKPIFLFQQYCAKICELKQKDYALQWTEDGWNVYQFNLNTGLVIDKTSGQGAEEYLRFLSEKGLTHEEVVFSVNDPVAKAS